MDICYQKKKQIIFTEACPENKLRALAASPETKLLTDCCRLALRYAEEDPATMSEWFSKRFMKFCREMTKDKGQTFLKKTNQQKLLLFADYEKGEHPFINFCARGYDESEVKDKKTGKMKKGPWRKQKYVRLSGLVAIDIDHVENPMAVFERWQKEVDFKALKIYLIYVTPRGNGLRVVFRCELSRGNLIDNQMWMCEKLGVEPDASCKDASRGFFLTSTENFLYDDLKQMYADEADDAFIQKFEPEYRAGRSGASPNPLQREGAIGSEAESPLPLERAMGSKAESPLLLERQRVGELCSGMGDRGRLCFKGIPYSWIIDEWWKRNGGVPQEGERNVKLYQLAVNLRAICDNNKALLLQVMPRLGLDEQEMQSIVESACKEPPKGFSKVIREIMGASPEASPNPLQREGAMGSKAESPLPLERQRVGELCSGMGDRGRLWDWGEQIEALSEDFPIIRDICKGLKKNQYPAALFVAGGFLMTLMTRCTYRFYHRPEELRRLNNSTFIIGDPASGKSFATRLYKLLTGPIVAADKIGKDAINAYREQMRTKGANKEKPKKPKVVVRIHPARTSNAQFIQDMVNSVEEVDGQLMQLHMLTFDTELDNTVTVQKGGSWIDKQSLELKAFHNEEDGQAYSNNDSILQDFYVTWNFIYTGTPIALKKKVNEQNFGSGLATRLTCIPLPATNFEMMAREATVDYESDNRLKEWAEKLDRMKGELTVQKLVDELYEWTSRRMADAKENDSKADEMLLKRCAYHGLNFAAPFIVMRHWDKMHQEGNYWCGAFETDEVDWKLAELIVNIQYACQRHYFGAMAEAYFDNKNREASVNVQRRQKTLEGFARLPEEFTVEDVMRCFSLNSESTARTKIVRLTADNLVQKARDIKDNGTTKSVYKKTSAIIL